MSQRERRVLIVVALILCAVLLIGGGVWLYHTTIAMPQQHVIEVMRTQRAEAGQTAVREFELTRQAQP